MFLVISRIQKQLEEVSMSGEILGVEKSLLFDDSIRHFKYHTCTPYASTQYGNNDEIRMPVQKQDVFKLASESFLYMEGKLTKKSDNVEGEQSVKHINNAMMNHFEYITYKLTGVEIDRIKNVGLSFTHKESLVNKGT